MLRTHSCNDLTKKNLGEEVTLCGWTHARRDHGGIIFIDLRDRYGITQVVFDPSHDKESHKIAEALRREFVIQVKGKVRARKQGMENPNLNTGEIEVIADKLKILSEAETPPIEIDDRVKVNEEFRLKYRYLDLRKPSMQQNLILRHKVVTTVRNFLNKNDFIEIETPILAKSTPEGARDYLVPSRVHPGKFFALPQSPQLFKQLLMISGMDRYYQIARCFRDEDLRADRQPEFTQIDIEMSFIEEDDIIGICENLVREVWNKAIGREIKIPFPRITYDEAIERFGIDRPDTRFGLELINVTNIVKDSEFSVFTSQIKEGGIVKCINAKGCAGFSRKEIEEMTDYVAVYGAKGLAWMKMQEELESSIVKFFSDEIKEKLIEKTGAEKGDLLLFVSDKKHSVVNEALANLRNYLGKKLGLADENKFNFIWVTDFPLLEFDDELGRYVAVHHPFTMPKESDLELLDKEPARVKSKAYDLVLNGTELGGGSIRIHRLDIQKKIFEKLNISEEEANAKFGFLLEALSYGAPPHGGIAFGLDRLIAILAKRESIRDVIAFPKNKAAVSLVDMAPSEVSEEQLKELHIKLDIVK